MKGFFKPRNISKYKGNPTQIVFRSSWELTLMERLDKDPSIIQWSSESIIIPYRSPLDGKIHRYFPDMWLKKKDGTQLLIEVKPKKQTLPPIKKGKVNRKYVREVITYKINMAKWESAKAYCEKRGYKFIFITETDLGIA